VKAIVWLAGHRWVCLAADCRSKIPFVWVLGSH